jgi:xanthine dehydrogenase small subunit
MTDQAADIAVPVRFLLGNEPVTLADADPTLTLLDYLRETAGRKGTKEGCAEGDCGACTVVIAEPDGPGLRYRPVNACIQLVGALHGKQVLTVEDVAAPDGSLHPVQAAMVEKHGSQCGFCTPGFVMSLFALYRQGRRVGRKGINDALAGNLCRCTGYGPIVAAAEAMWDTPGRDDHVTRGTDAAREALAAMEAESQPGLRQGGRALLSPRTADELARLLLAHPDAVMLAGGTDVGLWVTKQGRRPQTVIHTGRVAELARIEDGADAITIGAAVRLSEAATAIGALYPDFGEVFRRYGSVQVRNAGTLGGNVANGSPIGDSPPGLIALGAEMTLRRGDQRRRIAVEDFFIDYGKQDRQPSEFVESIIVPKPKAGRLFRMFKISKRFDQDISAVCAAFALEIVQGTVRGARIAYGGMAAIPKRARAAEAALVGRPWAEPAVRAAMAALGTDFAPLTDMRASAWYRQESAANLLLKVYLESQQEGRAAGVLDCEAA